VTVPTTFSYYVVAVDSGGLQSAPGNVVSVTVNPKKGNGKPR
jgi:hypothetical protein